jgi:hypothetical protein
MAKKTASSTVEAPEDRLSDEIQATRAIWNDGMESLSPTLQQLTAQLRRFAKDMFDSPLGKRAQRHPVASFGIASLAAVLCMRLLRR